MVRACRFLDRFRFTSVALLGWLAITTAGAQSVAPYFPVKIDSVRWYRAVYVDGGRSLGLVNHAVVRTVTEPGRVVHVVRMEELGSTAYDSIEITPNEVRQLGSIVERAGAAPVQVTFSPPLRLLRWPLSAGAQWQDYGDVTYTHEVTWRGPHTVLRQNVPDCVGIQMTDGRREEASVHCAGWGLVEFTIRSPDHDAVRFELVARTSARLALTEVIRSGSTCTFVLTSSGFVSPGSVRMFGQNPLNQVLFDTPVAHVGNDLPIVIRLELASSDPQGRYFMSLAGTEDAMAVVDWWGRCDPTEWALKITH
jgi:hypothetical protein